MNVLRARSTSRFRRGAGAANVTIQILVPKTAPTIAPRFVSPATKSLAIRVSLKGKTVQSVALNLSAGSKGCKKSSKGLACSVKLSLAPAKYTASFSTFSGAVKKGKPTGKELSADQRLPLNVPSKGLSVSIDDDLAGIPAKVAFVPESGSMLSGGPTAYTISRCGTATSQQVDVFGVDAAGYEILGKGAPKVSLASSNSSVLSVTGPSGNTFTLKLASSVASSVANVKLSAAAKASPLANGARATSTVKISFDTVGCITSYPLPSYVGYPKAIVAGPDGNLWLTFPHYYRYGSRQATPYVGRFDMTTHQLTAFDATGSLPEGITSGPSGDLWFADGSKCRCIMSVTTSGTIAKAVSLAGYSACNSYPGSISASSGADDDIYVDGCDGIFRYDPVTGKATVINPSSFSIQPTAYSPGPGAPGTEWFAGSRCLGYVTGGGSPTTFCGSATPGVTSLTAGPDGNMWFTSPYSQQAVGRITPSGKLTTYYVLSNYEYVNIVDIVDAPDGNLWFGAGYALVKLATDGTMTGYVLPTSSELISYPQSIAVGPDGNLWYLGSSNTGYFVVRFQLH